MVHFPEARCSIPTMRRAFLLVLFLLPLSCEKEKEAPRLSANEEFLQKARDYARKDPEAGITWLSGVSIGKGAYEAGLDALLEELVKDDPEHAIRLYDTIGPNVRGPARRDQFARDHFSGRLYRHLGAANPELAWKAWHEGRAMKKDTPTMPEMLEGELLSGEVVGNGLRAAWESKAANDPPVDPGWLADHLKDLSKGLTKDDADYLLALTDPREGNAPKVVLALPRFLTLMNPEARALVGTHVKAQPVAAAYEPVYRWFSADRAEAGDPAGDAFWVSCLSDPAARTDGKLRTTILPSVEFKEATVSSVLEALGKESRERDLVDQEEARKGVRLGIAEDRVSQSKLVTMSFKQVPLERVLLEISRQARLQMKVDKGGDVVFLSYAPEIEARMAALDVKLDKIVIPEVEFENLTIEEVAEQLQQLAGENDEGGSKPGQAGVPVHVRNLEERKERPSVTLQLENAPLREILKQVSAAAKVSIVTEATGVYLTVEKMY